MSWGYLGLPGLFRSTGVHEIFQGPSGLSVFPSFPGVPQVSWDSPGVLGFLTGPKVPLISYGLQCLLFILNPA